MQSFKFLRYALIGVQQRRQEKNKKRKICKIVAYGCQTPSAQRRSDQIVAYGCQTPSAQRRSDQKEDCSRNAKHFMDLGRFQIKYLNISQKGISTRKKCLTMWLMRNITLRRILKKRINWHRDTFQHFLQLKIAEIKLTPLLTFIMSLKHFIYFYCKGLSINNISSIWVI